MLKIPLELLEISVNKKFEIELETIEEQVAVSLGKYDRAVIKVIIDEWQRIEFIKTVKINKN